MNLTLFQRIAASLLLACLAYTASAQMPPGMMQPPPPADPAKVTARLAFLPDVLATFDPDQQLTRAEFLSFTASDLGFVLEPGITDEAIKEQLRPYIESFMQLRLVVACATDAGLTADYDAVRAQVVEAVAAQGPEVLGGQDQETIVKMVAERNMATEWVTTTIVNGITVTDEEVAVFFEQNKAQMGPGAPERRRVSHILVSVPPEATDQQRISAQAKISQLLISLKDGADFAETAKKMSECYSRRYGGDLGFLNEGDMGEKFDMVAFELAEGQLSDVVETHRGFHIIKVTKLEAGAGPQLTPELKTRIQQHLRDQKAGEAVEKRLADEATKRKMKVTI